jgi:hypothetical protein
MRRSLKRQMIHSPDGEVTAIHPFLAPGCRFSLCAMLMRVCAHR